MPLLTPPERVGTCIHGRYSLSRIVGQGVSAVLFAGHDRALDRAVALKVMRPDGVLSGGSERERFRLEAQTLARLRHPNLVEVFDVGETEDGVPFVVMELLRGSSLAERLDLQGALGIEEALTVLLPIMGALACAHDLGVVHRDVKPANMFLHDGGSRGVVPKLLDFGIAKLEHASGLTSSGMALGTPAFMAPEQARGEVLGPQVDVWAMGVTLYRAISGKLPFEAATAAGVLMEVIRGSAKPLARNGVELDRTLAFVIERALEPDLSRRHADMRVFAALLTRTAQRAALRLPNDPDPIGLPGYRAWRAETDVETCTAPIALVSPTQAPSVDELYTAREPTASQPMLVPKPKPWAVLVPIAALATLSAISLWSPPKRSTEQSPPRESSSLNAAEGSVKPAVPPLPPPATKPAVAQQPILTDEPDAGEEKEKVSSVDRQQEPVPAGRALLAQAQTKSQPTGAPSPRPGRSAARAGSLTRVELNEPGAVAGAARADKANPKPLVRDWEW